MINKDKPKDNREKVLLFQLIINISAILLILFTDFAGWYHGNYYFRIYEEGYIYLGSGVISTILLTLLMIILGLNTKLVYDRLKNRLSATQEKIKTKESLRNSKIAISVVILAAIAFIFSCISTETQEWWFGAAFYGMVISFGSTIFFNRNK